MLKNYLTIATRNIWRNKSIACLNVAGLTLGITSSIVLFLIITHALSFDTFQSKRNRIYRVVSQRDGNNGTNYGAGVPAVFPDAFRNDFPEAEQVVFVSYRHESLIAIPQPNGAAPKRFNTDNHTAFTSSAFFDVFDRKILSGDAHKGLDEPNEAILAKKSAFRYFGREDVIGESVVYDNIEYKITAIMEDYPDNTDFPFGILLSVSTIKKELDTRGWNSVWSDNQCYFLLKENESIDKIKARFPAFFKKYYGPKNENNFSYIAQPLSDLHFDDRFDNYSYNTTPRPALYSLGAIALFLVITACINFINLTTAEAIKRSKEVGIRKSLGSSRQQLVLQFLGETSLITFTAIALSLAVTQLVLLFLNPFLELSLKLTLDPALWLFITFAFVFVSLFSGLYPSFVVSGYNPVLALKNLMSDRNSSGYVLRRGLVVMQFFISQVFIIGTIIIVKQVDFFDRADLGFSKEAIITVPIPVREKTEANSASKMRTLKNEILKISGVEKASLNNAPPSSGSTSSTDFKVEGNSDNMLFTEVKTVDGDYVDLFKMHLLSGKNIADLDTTTGFLVNEKLAGIAGFANSEEMVGKQITLWDKRYPVVGVIKDFHMASLATAIEPVALFNRIESYRNLSIKTNAHDIQHLLQQVQQKWEAAYPEFIFSYEFLDEDIRHFYDGQRKMSTLITVFSSMAIFIGCLGLFSLVTFMANQKTKEIGVRKVLGASVESIVLLFSKEFVKLIALGFMLAAPVAWYVMNEYLNQFVYKITIGPMIFITCIASTFFIAMLTVSYRSLRAANANPVESLRSE
ncbi:MAG: ABC transporter permease [Bacteroidetes bacterium]|nr:ABC transporter permease [Bacteroidota bacterium]